MSAAKNIIAIHGAPRSGTSWLGQLFNSSPQVAYRYQPFFSYAFRGRIDTGSDVASLRGFFADLLDGDSIRKKPHILKGDALSPFQRKLHGV